MAFTLLKRESRREQHVDEVVVEQQQLEDARRDPLVRAFLLDADEYLAKLERDGRNG